MKDGLIQHLSHFLQIYNLIIIYGGAGEEKERKTEAEVVGWDQERFVGERSVRRKTGLKGGDSYETSNPHESWKECRRRRRITSDENNCQF